MNNAKKKKHLTLKKTFLAKEAGLSTSVKAGGPVPIILHLANKSKEPPKSSSASLTRSPFLTFSIT